MVDKENVIMCNLSSEEVKACIETALVLADFVVDRKDLHKRSYLERFINLVMGEIGEQSVLKWLKKNGKYAVSAVDKNSGKPDKGHDILLKNKKGGIIKCSVKSSLAAKKSEMNDILSTFNLASTKQEVRDVNIQVYFWLEIFKEPRTIVPSEAHAAIIGWAGKNDLEKIPEKKYATEERKEVQIYLKELRTMDSLLEFIE